MTAKLLSLDEAQAHLASFTEPYASLVVGDCMAPEISDGEYAVFDPHQWPKRGDMACIWLQGRNPKTGAVGVMPWIKRITMAGWECALPYRLVGDSNLEPLIGFEALNPPTHWTVNAKHICGLHRFIGSAADLGMLPNPKRGFLTSDRRKAKKGVRHAA